MHGLTNPKSSNADIETFESCILRIYLMTMANMLADLDNAFPGREGEIYITPRKSRKGISESNCGGKNLFPVLAMTAYLR
jgi:hypothetical protein